MEIQNSMLFSRKNIHEILSFSWPVCFSQLANLLCFTIGIMLISRLDINILVSAAIFISIQQTLLMLCVSFLFSIGIQLSNCDKKNIDEMQKIIHSGFVFAIILAAVSGLILLNIKKILILSGVSSTIALYTQHYFYGFIPSLFPGLLLSVFNQVHVGLKNTKMLAIFTLVQSVINIILVFLFIQLGFGIYSIGVANTIAILIILIYRGFYFSNTQPFAILRITKFTKIKFTTLNSLILLGLPISIQNAIELLTITILMLMLSKYGDAILATQQIVSQYNLLLYIIPLGLMQAATVFTGSANQEKNISEIRLISFNLTLLNVIFFVGVAIIYIFFNQDLVNLYLGHADSLSHQGVTSSASFIFTYYAIFQLIDALRMMKGGELRGMGNTKFPMYVGLCTSFVTLLCAFLFDYYFNYSFIGIYLALLIGSGINFIVLSVKKVFLIHNYRLTSSLKNISTIIE